MHSSRLERICHFRGLTRFAMMSSTHGGQLQGRQRQHRRQISTPTALDAPKAPSLPAQALQRINAHRRGQSLDQRGVRMQQRQQPMHTNQTAAQQQPQGVLREVQQQRLARQGHQVFPQHVTPMSLMSDCQTLSQDDLQLLSNQNTHENQHGVAYGNPTIDKFGNQMMGAQQTNVSFNMMHQQQEVLRNQNLPGNNLQMVDNCAWDMYQQENMGSFPPQANMIPEHMRRLSAQSDVGSNAQHPHTPAHSNTRKNNRSRASTTTSNVPLIDDLGYFPITPATTPFKKSMGAALTNREVQPSPTKEQNMPIPETANASYMQRARSLQGVSGASFSQQKVDLPSPPNTASFEVDGFDTFNCEQQEPKSENPESKVSSHNQYAPSLSASSSFYSSPEIAAMPSPGGGEERAHKIPILPVTPSHKRMSSTTSTATSTPAKPKLSPRVASIDNLNLDDRVHASINQTGVTIDDIASYIHGPDSGDGKWVCIHPGCGRRFGRKENIKSHVQTHLGDRQFKCDHCSKCFVRGHDLKRHAKIHTGDKPYECLCGNVFARHDALTRHRQRGMCVGGYKGIVRKTTKRGRPKKHRPEMEERQDKSSRTRQRVAEKSYAGSVSGSSDAYHSSPPSDIFDSASLRGSSPTMNGPMFSTPNYSALPPEAFTFTPPASPGCSTGNKRSPRVNPRSLTPCTEDEMLPSSPSRQPLDRIVEESNLPFNADSDAGPYPDVSNANSLSSPHTAPTLADSSQESDLDIFINQDATTTGFGESEFPGLTDPAMATFPDYINTSALDAGGLDFSLGKSFSTGPTMDDDFFSFQFQVDEQPTELFLA